MQTWLMVVYFGGLAFIVVMHFLTWENPQDRTEEVKQLRADMNALRDQQIELLSLALELPGLTAERREKLAARRQQLHLAALESAKRRNQ